MNIKDPWRDVQDLADEPLSSVDPDCQPLLESLRGFYHGLNLASLSRLHPDRKKGALEGQLEFLTEGAVLAKKDLYGVTHYRLTDIGERFLTPPQHLPKRKKPGAEPA